MPELKLLEQQHRTKIDRRRYTDYSFSTKRRIEFDRVFVQESYLGIQFYILECKFSIVRGKDLRRIYEKAAGSKMFGVNSPVGRIPKTNVTILFASGAFNPSEWVPLAEDKSVSLGRYAEMCQVNLLKAADFNRELSRFCEVYVTVQKISRACESEDHVRLLLARIFEEGAQQRVTKEKYAALLQKTLAELSK